MLLYAICSLFHSFFQNYAYKAINYKDLATPVSTLKFSFKEKFFFKKIKKKKTESDLVMGKKSGNSWLNAVKKAFRSPTNENEKRSSRRREEEDDPEGEEEEKKRGKKRWIFRRHSSVETTIQHNVANSSAVKIRSGQEILVRKQPKTETSDAEQRRAFAEAVARTAAAEAAVAMAVEIIRQTRQALLLRQEKAALVIQNNFRGYLARRALMALRGVVKLQAIIRGHNVRKRAKLTLECIQSLVRVQSLVCDQRRRLSLDIFTTPIHKISSRGSSREVEEIHALIQKAKECSLKQGKTLAHALSQQISGKEEDEISSKSYPWMRKDRSLCSVEVDGVSSRPPTFHGRNLNLSPRTPSSSSKIRSIPCSPCYQREGRMYEDGETPTWRRRMSMSENSRPNYMAATASAMARVSSPRQRLSSSPCRETTGSGSARKRLSFPAYDGYESNLERCRGGLRSDMPYYGTD